MPLHPLSIFCTPRRTSIPQRGRAGSLAAAANRIALANKAYELVGADATDALREAFVRLSVTAVLELASIIHPASDAPSPDMAERRAAASSYADERRRAPVWLSAWPVQVLRSCVCDRPMEARNTSVKGVSTTRTDQAVIRGGGTAMRSRST